MLVLEVRILLRYFVEKYLMEEAIRDLHDIVFSEAGDFLRLFARAYSNAYRTIRSLPGREMS